MHKPASILSTSAYLVSNGVKAGIIIISVLAVITFFFRSIKGDVKRVPSMAEGLIRMEKKQETRLKEIEVYDKKHRTYYAQIGRSMSCKLSGYFCGDSYGFDRERFKDSYIGSIASVALFPIMNPPASGARYVAQKVHDAGIMPQAFAAGSSLNRGVGFASVDPLLPIWKVMRSVALMVLVVLTLMSGFFVMFRYKVNAQTSIAIENAIPKILITMLLIVFSFAIAGFVIDLMYISIGALMAFASTIQFGDMKIDQGALFAKYFDAGPDDLLGLYMGDLDIKRFCTGASCPALSWNGNFGGLWNVLWNLPEALLSIAGGPLELVLRVIGGFIGWLMIIHPIANFMSESVSPGVTAEISAILAGGSATWAKFIPNVIKLMAMFSFLSIVGTIIIAIVLNIVIGLVILLSVIFQAIKLFFMLLSSYIRILLLIIFAPIMILPEAIPGNSAFKDWFRNLLAEVMVFPILIGLFLAGSVIIFAVTDGLDCGLTRGAPGRCMLIQLPFLRGIEAEAFGIILGMALLFLMPELTIKAKKAINPKEAGFPNFGLGTFFGGAKPMLGFGIGAAAGLMNMVGYRGRNDRTQKDLIAKLKGKSPVMKTALDALFPDVDYLKELWKQGRK